ncbi:MAG TPA: 4-hydroxy-3-methylbut-2-enyl diphosphate reductase [Geminicoccus sp.]|uniref:4-hydroxy-3-methylbut-2-enyl diphosphate reductase n=1 Tax=Geminicoccus sp. TaxID=2024832 RepID=UPI002CF706FA|nr:4-hydroxy-3-methylbut-2-enyl diphosphate reductase [Geminicoccus sp.]HWL70837.1 4-hydroxy-3-methylbut-2-enyl diphosphate reductase [Geminicoccus sp.]
MTSSKPALTIVLASPRGFCAGVDRAIQIVKQALAENGPPVYVRHEIVHNRYVVEELEAMGAVFVEELDQVPDDGIVVFSAHGVPKSVPNEARRRRLLFADATCPLVSKVHREVERHHKAGLTVVLIGHAGHPEVIGTMGQVPDGSVLLVETVEDVARLEVPDPERLAFSTQTTLSVLDTAGVVAALKERFPRIEGPRNEDICYATTNRQQAVAAIAPGSDLTFVVGAKNSSNSMRLVEVAKREGCPRAELIRTAADIDWDSLGNVRRLALSAGASAPEILVDQVIEAARQRYEVTVEEVKLVDENVTFRVPPLPRRRPAQAA